MDIAVVGSYQDSMDKLPMPISFEVFKAACQAIGKLLGEEKHRLIIAHRVNPHDEKASAEAIALKGFFETEGRMHFMEVPYHEGDPQLKAHTEAVDRSDAVILIGGKEGTYAAGLTALLRRKMIIAIPAFGGSGRDLTEIEEINNTVIDELRNLDTNKDGWQNILTKAINSVIISYPRILIVHGRGDSGEELREQIVKAGNAEGILYGIGKPEIMDLSGKGAVSVPDVFEDFASKVSATIAVVTADDVGGYARLDSKRRDDKKGFGRELSATELRLTPRARENVWVEVGWFWGRLDRRRIFLWLKDNIPLPTDLQGAAWVKGNLDKAWPAIQNFIINLRKGTN
jgi:hypothetical protein